MLNDTYAVTDLNVLNVDIYIIKSGLAQSVERLFYKTSGRRFRPQWFFSVFFFLLFFFFFFFVIVILNYCKVDYKV